MPLIVSSTILGATVNSVITSKAGKRLWFMKQLRKAGVSQDDLIILMFQYQSVVRPVLEYVGT